MPTYDYKCDACGHRFEKFQSITAAPIKKCPECKKNKVKRLIGTGAGLIFKGSGFYITDYRDQSYKDKAKAESGSTEGAAAKSEKAEPSTSTTGANADPSASSTKSEPAKSEKPAAKSETKSAKKSGKKSD